jgi:hypothetical protein
VSHFKLETILSTFTLADIAIRSDNREYRKAAP